MFIKKYSGALLIVVAMFGGLAYWGYQYFKPKSQQGKVAVTGGKALDFKPKNPTIYFQKDKKWGSDKIGGSGETLASSGCVVSSVSMGLLEFGIDINPKKLNQKLKEMNGFTSNGWVIWDKIRIITEGKVKVSIPKKANHEVIDNALAKGFPVLAKVYLFGVQQHWVLIVGKKENQYLMKDPLGNGQIETMKNLGSDIYAIRILKPKE